METKLLSEQLNKIEMPKEMQERIIKNCYQKMEEQNMSKNTTKHFFKKPMAAVASLALCLCLTGVTALASAGKLEGFFRDITNWNGAVIGTTYEQATDEVALNIIEADENLSVEIIFLNPQIAPYFTFDTFGIESYQIVDAGGNVVMKGDAPEMAEIVADKVTVTLPLDSLSAGSYKLVVNKLVGSSKADQPLVLNGAWECEFVK